MNLHGSEIDINIPLSLIMIRVSKMYQDTKQ